MEKNIRLPSFVIPIYERTKPVNSCLRTVSSQAAELTGFRANEVANPDLIGI